MDKIDEYDMIMNDLSWMLKELKDAGENTKDFMKKILRENVFHGKTLVNIDESIAMLKAIYQEMVLKTLEWKQNEDILEFVNGSEKVSQLEKLNMMKIASLLVREEIEESNKEKINHKKLQRKLKVKIASYVLLGSTFLGLLGIIFKETKETDKTYKYMTYRSKYTYQDEIDSRRYEVSQEYENKRVRDEEITICEYDPWKQGDDYMGEVVVRKYTPRGYDYDEIIQNILPIVEEMYMNGRYVEEVLNKPINELINNFSNNSKIYEVVRIVQDKTNKIEISHDEMKIITISLLIFLEMVLYAKAIDNNGALIIASLWKNIRKLLEINKLVKSDIERIEIYQKVYYDLYINDLCFRDEICAINTGVKVKTREKNTRE